MKNLKTHLENPSRSAFLRNFLTELMRFWSEKVDWSPIWRHFTVCTNLKIEGNPKHSAMEFWLWLKKPHHRVLSVSQPIWGYEGLIRFQLSDFEVMFGKKTKMHRQNYWIWANILDFDLNATQPTIIRYTGPYITKSWLRSWQQNRAVTILLKSWLLIIVTAVTIILKIVSESRL